MEKNNKIKLNLFFCINGLQKGGAEKQLSYITNYLSDEYRVHIFTLDNIKTSYKFKKNITLHKKIGIFYFITQTLKLKPKVIFFVLPKSYFFFGTLAIIFPNIKKVLMRRSLNYYHKNIFYKYYEIFLHRFTDIFITNSEAAKKNMIKTEFINKKRVFLINNYIEKFSNYSQKEKKKKIFKILCISNFYEYKGHRLLIKTLSLISHLKWELFLLGENRDVDKKSLIKFAKKYKIDDRIHFIKKINQKLIFPKISLGVLFSNTESFPNAIMEYLMLKLPVFAYNTGDVPKLVNDSNGKIFKKRDPLKIAKDLSKLILDDKLHEKSKKSFLKVDKYTIKSKTLFLYSYIIKRILCVE